MSIDEIRGAFLGFYEKRLKLQLLQAELQAVEESASEAIISKPDEVSIRYSLVTFDTRVIETVLSDTYAITAGNAELLATLQKLRQQVAVANNKAQIFFSVALLAFTNKARMIQDHNEFMASACRRIVELAARARALLASLLAG